MKSTYKIVFNGRLLHAIGSTYECTETVEATDKTTAIISLYHKYDCVHFPEVFLIENGKEIPLGGR